jgi:hypothetical protein
MTRLFSRIVSTGLVSLGLVVLANSAMAATDGTLGLTSIGTTDVSIIMGDTAQITGLTDIILMPWSVGDPVPIGTTNACVYTSTHAFRMTATSANG